MIVYISMTFLFCLLVVRLFVLQIVDGGYLSSRGSEQWYRDLPLAAPRGIIYDSNGRVMADNALCYTVYVRPNALTERQRAIEVLSSSLPLSAQWIEEKLSQNKSEITLARRIDVQAAEQISHAELAGVYLAAGYQRSYPNGSAAAKVIGFTNIDNDGQNGLEGYYDKYLSGVDGFAYTSTDIAGRETETTTTSYVPPLPGCDIELTLDGNIQAFAESAVIAASLEWGAKGCSAIVMDVNSGAVKAMAAYPSYDLNDIPRDDIDLLNALSKNSLITDVYEPGSTFKIFTTAAAIENGKATESSRYYCGGGLVVDGQRIKCWRTIGHGSQSLGEGVKNSCNCVFMNLALSLGTDRLYESLHAFGFGSKSGIDFYGESSGIMMNKASVKNGDLARIGFGQTIAVTPLQLISGVSAAVNGGTLYQPYFVSRVVSAEGETVAQRDKTILSRPISQSTSSRMRALLEAVVSEGSGKKAAADGVRVGGKTGTAQKYEDGKIAQGKYVSSFVGFAPADQPKYAVLFIVDEPSGYVYYGSLTAAPYAGRIFSRIADYENWQRQSGEAAELTTMPEVIGLCANEAVTLIEQAGLKVEIDGDSGIVISSTPAAFTELEKGDVVLIRLDSS